MLTISKTKLSINSIINQSVTDGHFTTILEGILTFFVDVTK